MANGTDLSVTDRGNMLLSSNTHNCDARIPLLLLHVLKEKDANTNHLHFPICKGFPSRVDEYSVLTG